MTKIKGVLGIFSILIVLMLSSVAYAAVIKGNTYDFSLNSISDVIVEVDSSPKQTYVVKDGSYLFTLPPGSYIITASQKSDSETIATASEKIDIKSDGEFSLDLILFPVIDSANIDDVNAGVSLENQNNLLFIYILAAVALFIVIGLAIRFFSSRKVKKTKHTEKKAKKRVKKEIHKKAETKTEENAKESKKDVYDSHQVIEILKKHGGRATQKDIRKDIPLSEAKISLMIAELESKGKIEKIKKGRGNIIILK